MIIVRCFTLFLCSVALWSPETLACGEGLEALSEGDRAWFDGDRKTAVACWRRAAEGEQLPSEAMARLRLLQFTGNWGMVVHGPRIDRALRACPDGDPWCWIADADYHLLAPREVGARPEEVPAIVKEVQGELPGPALARTLMVEPDPAGLESLEGMERDGLGDGIVANEGRLPAYPGTWLLGLGLLGGPGLGFGGGVHFVHPDLFWRDHDLALEAGATTRGSAWLAAGFVSAGRVFGHGDGMVARWVQDLYQEDEVVEWRVEGARVTAGPGLRVGGHRWNLGATMRWDRVDGEALAGHGGEVGWSWDRRKGWGGERRGTYLGLSADAAGMFMGADYGHLLAALDLRGYLGLPWDAVLAGRVVGERAFLDGVPWYRQPYAGGPEVLRGAPAGRYRGASLVAADLELRRMVAGPLEGVVFGCAAWVEGTGAHPCGGAGIRLLLPPRQLNVVRLDLGVSDDGWAVSTGWGEVF